MTRRCGDVANFGYWLRCYGDTVRGEAAQIFDQDLRSSFESTIGGQILGTSWWQSNISVDKAGLGLRTATDIALPAFIGSRVSCRPMVATMFGHIEEAGMGSAAALLHAYDQRTTQAEDDTQNQNSRHHYGWETRCSSSMDLSAEWPSSPELVRGRGHS